MLPAINCLFQLIVLTTGYVAAAGVNCVQSGRAGRTGTPGVSIVLADDHITKSALSLYYLDHPEEYLAQDLPELVFDPSLPPIRQHHLKAAARELPLRREDAFWFEPEENFLVSPALAERMADYHVLSLGSPQLEASKHVRRVLPAPVINLGDVALAYLVAGR
jgi:hypothetical protein